MDSILEWVKGFDMVTVGIVVAMVGLAVLLFWDKLPKPGLPSLGSGDDAAYHAVKTLVEHFSKVGCEEGKAAARECGRHLFTDHPHA